MNRRVFFESVRLSLFARSMSSLQVKGTEALIDYALTVNGLRRTQLAYILATAYWETGRTMQPVDERGSGDGPDADKYDDYLEKYDTGRLAKALGNTPEADGDGILYKGRGFVQITGRANYKKASDRYGVDFIRYPERVKETQYSVRILFDGMLDGWFTGLKLASYINAERKNYIDARRTVNGVDKASTIAHAADLFESALVASGFPDMVMANKNDVPVPLPPLASTPVAEGWWAKFMRWIATWRTAR